jgi:hypothetical protein
MMIKKPAQNITAGEAFRELPVLFPGFGPGFFLLLGFCILTPL